MRLPDAQSLDSLVSNQIQAFCDCDPKCMLSISERDRLNDISQFTRVFRLFFAMGTRHPVNIGSVTER